MGGKKIVSFEEKRVVIIDDHPAILHALKAVLEKNGYSVVGEGKSVEDGRLFLSEPESDILITDLTFLDGEGDEFIQEWRKKKRNSKIIAFSMHKLPYTIQKIMAAGADAFFCKLDELELLPIAIEEVISGGVYYSPTIVKSLKENNKDVNQVPAALLLKLSPMEKRILNHLGRGNSRKEIARLQKIECGTIETHLRRAQMKLGIKNRRDLIRFAIFFQDILDLER